MARLTALKITEARGGLLCLVLALVGAYAPHAHAIPIAWAANAGGTWNAAASWNPAQIPTAADDVTFGNNINVNITVTVATGMVCKSITFANTASTVTLNAGTITIGNGGAFAITATGAGVATIGSALTLTGAMTLTNSGTVNISGVISGNGFLVNKAGAGTLSLTAANTFNGGINHTAGVISIGNNAGFGAGTLTIGAAGVTIQSSAAETPTNAIAANNDFIVGGTQTFTSTGTMTLNAARIITVNNTGATSFGAINGNTFGLTFSGSGSTTVTGIIGTTSGSVTKNGTGTLTLSGANTFTGGVTVNGGTLSLANANGGGAAGSIVTLSAGTLNFATGGLTYLNPVTVTGTSALTFPNNQAASNAVTVSGAFTHSNGTLSLNASANGGSSLTLSGNTTISGGANIGINAPLTVTGTTVTLAGTPTFTGASTATFTSGVTSSASAITQTGATINFNGTFTLANAQTISQTGGLMKFGGNLAGNFTLNKSGAGTMTFEGAQSSTTTPVTVAAGNFGGSGSLASSLTINSGGTFAPGTGAVGTGSVIGTFTTSTDVIFNANSSASFQLGAPTSNDLLNVTGAGVLNFAGATSIKFAPSPGFVAGQNYTIATTVQNMTGASANLTFVMPGYTVTSNAATATTALTVSAVPDAAAQLTWAGGSGINLSTAANWTPAVSPNSGTFELTFAGANPGSLTNDLTSNVLALNFTAGGYTITGGTLTITSGGATPGNAITSTTGTTAITSALVFTGSAPTLTVSGGTLNATTGTVNNGGFPLTVNNVGAGDTLTGVISGSGGLIKNGVGTLTLGTGTNTYTGATTINNGTLALTVIAALANTSQLNIQGASAAAPATFSYNGATVTLPNFDINLGTNTNANIISVGANELQTNFNNKITGGASGITALLKSGAGLFGNISGGAYVPSTFLGDTRVVAGSVRVHSNAQPNRLFSAGTIFVGDTTGVVATTFMHGGNPTPVNDLLNPVVIGPGGGTATLTSSNNGNIPFYQALVTLNNHDVTINGGGANTAIAAQVFNAGFTGTGNATIKDLRASGVTNQVCNYDFRDLNLTGGMTLAAPTNAQTTATASNLCNIRLLNAATITGTLTVSGLVDNTQQYQALNLHGFGFSMGSLAGTAPVIDDVAGAVNLTITDGAGQTHSGTISNATGTISLVKSGPGSQTLSGNNTFSGSVTVNGGTLALTGTNTFAGATTINNGGTLTLTTATTSNIAASSAITVASGGTVDVSGVSGGFALAGTQTLTDNGTVTGGVAVGTGRTLKGSGSVSGTVTLTSGGVVAPGNNNIGTLSVGGFTANAGTVPIEIGGASSDKIVVSGAASLTGSTFAVTFPSPPTAPNYQVLTSGTLTGTPTVTGSVGRTSITINSGQLANQILQLDVSGFPAHAVFTPAADGTWNSAQTVANWTTTDVGVVDTTHYYDGDFVLFDDTNTGTRAVNLTSSVSPGTVTVDNSAGDYTVSGAGSIAGTASLTKSGTGALTISNTNTFSGGTTINGGIINVNAAGALGSGTITINSGGTLSLNVAGALTTSPIIVNTGGTLLLTSAASATSLGSGLLTINGGTLDNTTAGAIVSSTNPPQIWGGSFTYTGTQGLNIGTGNVTLNANVVITVNGTVAANGLTVGGIIANGTNNSLSKAGTGTLTLTANSSTYTGTTAITGGTLLVSNSTTAGIFTTACALGASTADIPITNGKLQLNPGVAVTSLARTFTLNNNGEFFLQQAGNIAAAGPWTINAVDATPAIFRYITINNTWGTPVTVPALTAGVSNTLRIELNNGVTNGAGGQVILNGAAFPCKIVLAGVPGGNASALGADTNVGKLVLPGNVTAGTGTLFFENAMQVGCTGAGRILSADIIITSGITAFSGRGTGTSVETPSHELILAAGKTLTVQSGATASMDLGFRVDQAVYGGVLHLGNTILNSGATPATLRFLRSDPAVVPGTHSFRSNIIAGNIIGTGANSVIDLLTDTHDGGYSTIDNITTGGGSIVVTTTAPHTFAAGDIVFLGHNEDGTLALPAPTPGMFAGTAGNFTVASVTPTSITITSALGASNTTFTAKPVVGIVGAGFASSSSLIVNGGLTIQGTGARIQNMLSTTRLNGVTGSGGFLAPKPSGAAATLAANTTTWPNNITLRVQHTATSNDIQLGGAFSNHIAVGATSAETLATLDGNGQTVSTSSPAGVNVRGYGKLAGVLVIGANASLWPGSTAGTNVLPAAEVLQGTGAVDLTNGKFKCIIGNPAAPVAQQLNGGAVLIGANSVLSLAVQSGNYGGVDIPIIICSSPSITAAFTPANTLNLPSGWTVIYKAAGVPVDPTMTPADSVALRTNNNSVVTPVKLADFKAEPQGAGVRISWNAVSEFKNAGFNLYRKEPRAPASDWARVNPALIAGRITAPDEKQYSFYDWAAAGEWQYKLESVSLAGAKETYEQFAGPVSVDWNTLETSSDIDAASITAAGYGLIVEAGVRNAERVGAAFSAIDARVPRSSTLLLAAGRAADPKSEVKATQMAQQHGAEYRSVAPGASLTSSASVRWLSAASASAAGGTYTGVKIQYSTPGVLFVAQSSLPAGFDVNHVSIQREGRSVSALGVVPGGLLLYAPGYQDDYTDKDAFFLRRIAGRTQAGTAPSASNLFTSTLPVNTSSPANASVQFHDVYFDFNYRPFNFTPWFSGQYLTGGTTQSFSLNTPAASGGAAVLTIDLWSLTSSDTVNPDHALQVVVNGQPVGSTLSWDGGDRAMQLTVNIPGGVLNSGANQIDLVTPSINGVDSQIAFLHALSVDYTRTLDGAKSFELSNTASTPQLFELFNVPSANAYVVDTRFAGRETLVAAQTQADADGTYRLRFTANAGGKYIFVPSGQENAPLNVSLRQVKPVRLSGTYLATGPSQFSSGVQPLLLAHTREGIRSQYVDQEQLFDYYNFGRFGPAGIQKAVRATKPQYLLLLGRTTYDYKNYGGAGVDPLCPTFLVSTSFWAQSTSDSKFGDLGRGYPEVAVGRLPANNAGELAAMVSRILAYKGAPVSGVRGHLVADVTDQEVGDFGQQLAVLAQAHPDVAWQTNTLGVTYQTAPEVTGAMTAAANGGADLIIYNGHGNSVRLGKNAPRILDTDLVQEWKGNVIFLQSTCTANWMAKDETGFKSIAIQAMTQPQGGISASIGTSTYMNPDAAMAFMDQLLRNAGRNGTRWGKALMLSQQWALRQNGGASGTAGFYKDIGNTEQIFGDPAMNVFAAPDHRGNGSTTPGAGNTPMQPGVF